MIHETSFTRPKPCITASFYLPVSAKTGDQIIFEGGHGSVEQVTADRLVLRIEDVVFICRPLQKGDDAFLLMGSEMWWTISGIEGHPKPSPEGQ